MLIIQRIVAIFNIISCQTQMWHVKPRKHHLYFLDYRYVMLTPHGNIITVNTINIIFTISIFYFLDYCNSKDWFLGFGWWFWLAFGWLFQRTIFLVDDGWWWFLVDDGFVFQRSIFLVENTHRSGVAPWLGCRGFRSSTPPRPRSPCGVASPSKRGDPMAAMWKTCGKAGDMP